MKYKLSFCTVNRLSDQIAEVIVNSGIEISIEMVEELEVFFAEYFTQPFGVLINKVNHYYYAFEAKLVIGSHAHLKAIAVVNYSKEDQDFTDNFVKIRTVDQWNIQSFSGLDLGWQQAYEWLKKELSTC
ncbi:MAG: hypothetical protein QF552_10460 [Litorilituus sp.]|jgi:hypothetical protein|nr:hypothetical protein [Litorilituus sp.]